MVNLNRLAIDRHQRNNLAESRIYLDPNLMDRFEGREYVGLATARWNQKYMHSGIARLEDLHEYEYLLDEKVVLVADLADPVKWIDTTCFFNIGMHKFIDELAEWTGMPRTNGPSFWANNFICHRSVFADYLKHFLKVFDYFTNKYDNRFDFKGMDPKRTPAFFYEAVTVHYFANRSDLTFKLIKKPPR
jgi:hypothetical protein